MSFTLPQFVMCECAFEQSTIILYSIVTVTHIFQAYICRCLFFPGRNSTTRTCINLDDMMRLKSLFNFPTSLLHSEQITLENVPEPTTQSQIIFYHWHSAILVATDEGPPWSWLIEGLFVYYLFSFSHTHIPSIINNINRSSAILCTSLSYSFLIGDI